MTAAEPSRQDRPFYLLVWKQRGEVDGEVSEARARLLASASRLFYSEGLHSVGIDRVIADAGVTRATLYRHFPSKDDLLVAYLTAADQAIRADIETARTGKSSGADAVRAVAESIADGIRTPG